MGSARKQYMFRDTSVILESSPDGEMPYIIVRADRGGALKGNDLFNLSTDLQALLEAAYKSNDFQTSTVPQNTAKSIGFRISYTGDGYTIPKPDEFFNGALSWLNELAGNIVEADGDFKKGLALTKQNIAQNTSKPNPEDPEQDEGQKWQPAQLKKLEYSTGNVDFQVEETHTPGKYEFSFHEDMKALPDIQQISDKMRELIGTAFKLQKMPVAIEQSNDSPLSFTIKTHEDVEPADFLNRCDRLFMEINVLANKEKNILQAMDMRIAQLQTATENKMHGIVAYALETAMKKIPGMPQELKDKSETLGTELMSAVFAPHASAEAGINAIQSGKDDDVAVKARLRGVLIKHIQPTGKNDAQIKYFIGELADVVYSALPKRESVQGRSA